MNRKDWYRQTLQVYIERILNDPKESSGWFELDAKLGWTPRIVKDALKELGYSKIDFDTIDEEVVDMAYENDKCKISCNWNVYDFDLYFDVLKK